MALVLDCHSGFIRLSARTLCPGLEWVAVHLPGFLESLFEGTVFQKLPRRLSHAFQAQRIGQQVFHGVAEGLGVIRGDDQPRFTGQNVFLGPPWSVTMTGNPEAWASRMTFPKVSVLLGKDEQIGRGIGRRQVLPV